MLTDDELYPDTSPKTPSSESNIDETSVRRTYLEALGAGLGANPTTVNLSIDALMIDAQLLREIDYLSERSTLNPAVLAQIEAIGNWFMSGSTQAEQLKFTVGARILALLNEDPASGYFTGLRSWVSKWTDGIGDTSFDEVLARSK